VLDKKKIGKKSTRILERTGRRNYNIVKMYKKYILYIVKIDKIPIIVDKKKNLC
jgi:hypothetical protein